LHSTEFYIFKNMAKHLGSDDQWKHDLF